MAHYTKALLKLRLIGTFLAISTITLAQRASIDTVSARQFDMGRMWTFENPPTAYFAKTYGFAPDEKWFEKARLSALRFASYCSASFVSADGLVMTNHHCARESGVAVQKKGEDFMGNGFYAAKVSDERKVPELYVDQLVRIQDITDDVQQAIKTAGQAKSVKQVLQSVEQQYGQKTEWTGLQLETVSLYQGGRYSLYGFKRYDDVRLVFMPELQLGFFGGDPDNFTYPRYNLDCSFFRVYDDKGKPLKTQNYFKFNTDGVSENEPVFVVGNPGSTGRLKTVDELALDRDLIVPFTLQLLRNRSLALQAYNKTAKSDSILNEIFSLENSYKAYEGRLEGMNDPELMKRKLDFELKFKGAVRQNPALAADYATWDKISEDVKKVRTVRNNISVMQPNKLVLGELLLFAHQLVGYIHTDQSESAAKKGAIKAFSPESMVLEEAFLAAHLKEAKMLLGEQDEYVKTALAGRTPEQAASEILHQTRMTDQALVDDLIAKGPKALEKSDDPLIRLALIGQPRFEAAIEVTTAANARISAEHSRLGRLLYAVYGTAIPPDATFSLRISDGVVKPFEYNGTVAPVKTTYYGMYDRYYSNQGQFPWNLPKRWQNPPAEMLKEPVNFISTNDIIGGNSGSPMVNQKLEAVGLIFDGNVESLPGYFIFAPDAGNRTVSVHAGGIIAAMKHIYKANRLVSELTGK